MSSILNALKKLEEEKIVRRPDSLDIDAEILRNSSTRRFSVVTITTVAALLLICGGGATYLYMTQSTPLHSEIQPARQSGANNGVPPRVINSDTATVPVEHIAPVTVKPAPPLSPLQNERFTRKQTQQSQAVATNYQPGKQKGIASAGSHQSTASASTPHPPQSVKTSTEKSVAAPPSSSPTPHPHQPTQIPTLKVSGIAFQNGIDSMAMINGTLMSKGNVIEGIKIEEIQKDRVMFSYNGEVFEIGLGKSNH